MTREQPPAWRSRWRTRGSCAGKPTPTTGRINHLYPTERALALRPQVEAVIDELHGVLYRGLSGEEIAQASALVARMRRNLADEIDRQRSSK